MGDKTQGGGVKKTLVKKTKNDWWEGEKNEKRFKKAESRMLISQHRVSLGEDQGKQAQASPKASQDEQR